MESAEWGFMSVSPQGVMTCFTSVMNSRRRTQVLSDVHYGSGKLTFTMLLDILDEDSGRTSICVTCCVTCNCPLRSQILAEMKFTSSVSRAPRQADC